MGLFDKFKKEKSEVNESVKKEEINKEAIKNEETREVHSAEEAYNCLLELLSTILPIEAELRGDYVYFPTIDVKVTPEVGDFKDKLVTLYFYISSPKWDKTLFETSSGVGSTNYNALGSALASFVFCFMQGIRLMEEKAEENCKLDTIFVDNKHSWKVYRTDLISVGGNAPSDTSPTMYWDKLEAGIKKRLGNQTICYVKIFLANFNGKITSEVRVDDIVSPELSDIIAPIANSWDNEKYTSHKQFFFIRQDEETILPDDYKGYEGYVLLKSKVEKAARLFKDANTDELYGSLPERITEQIGDRVLADECFLYLPELCTANAFPNSGGAETINFMFIEKQIEVYKSQLSNYDRLIKALLDLLNEGTFGDDTRDIYGSFIGSSASYNVLKQAEENGANIQDLRLSSLAFNVQDDFVIR